MASLNDLGQNISNFFQGLVPPAYAQDPSAINNGHQHSIQGVSPFDSNDRLLLNSSLPNFLNEGISSVEEQLRKLPKVNLFSNLNLNIPSPEQRREGFIKGVNNLLPQTPLSYLPQQDITDNAPLLTKQGLDVLQYTPIEGPQHNMIMDHPTRPGTNTREQLINTFIDSSKSPINFDTKTAQAFYTDLDKLREQNPYVFSHVAHHVAYSSDADPTERAKQIYVHLGANFGPGLFNTAIGKYYNGVIDPNTQLQNGKPFYSDRLDPEAPQNIAAERGFANINAASFIPNDRLSLPINFPANPTDPKLLKILSDIRSQSAGKLANEGEWSRESAYKNQIGQKAFDAMSEDQKKKLYDQIRGNFKYDNGLPPKRPTLGPNDSGL